MKKFLAVGAMVVLGSLVTYGVPVCAPRRSPVSFGDGTTADLTGSCVIGGDTFSDFSITGNNGVVPTTMSASVSTSGNTLIFGYTGISSTADVYWQFEITGSPIIDIILQGGSTSQVIETVCDSTFTGEGCNGNVLNITANSTSTNGSNVTVAIGPNSDCSEGNCTYWVNKDVTGGSGFNQTIVPEPMTMSLMGIGLLGLGLARRLRRKS